MERRRWMTGWRVGPRGGTGRRSLLWIVSNGLSIKLTAVSLNLLPSETQLRYIQYIDM